MINEVKFRRVVYTVFSILWMAIIFFDYMDKHPIYWLSIVNFKYPIWLIINLLMGILLSAYLSLIHI